MPISPALIQSKAPSIFNTFSSYAKYLLYNQNFSGKAARADFQVAKIFLDDLDEIIKEGGYHLELIFSVDETRSS